MTVNGCELEIVKHNDTPRTISMHQAFEIKSWNAKKQKHQHFELFTYVLHDAITNKTTLRSFLSFLLLIFAAEPSFVVVIHAYVVFETVFVFYK